MKYKRAGGIIVSKSRQSDIAAFSASSAVWQKLNLLILTGSMEQPLSPLIVLPWSRGPQHSENTVESYPIRQGKRGKKRLTQQR